MNKDQQKEKAPKEDINQEFRELRTRMIDLMLEEERENNQNELESFDIQKEKAKQQCNEIFDEQLDQLRHGYMVIIDTITAQLKK